MRVLLTGATGFIGSHVASSLLGRGLAVTALVRPGSDPWRLADLGAAPAVVEADLADADTVAGVLRDAAPEVVCDLAWEGVGNPHHRDPRQIKANLAAHLELVAAAGRAGCRRFIGFGSQAEYGPQPAAIDERCLPAPTTLYGAVKLSVGVLGRQLAAQAGMEFVWLRLFSAYGPMDNPGWLIPAVTLSLLRGAYPKLTAGTQKWDYLFVKDAAGAVLECVTGTAVDGVFNLGSGQSVPVREIVETIRGLVDPALPLGFGELPYRPQQTMHLEADVTALCRAIPWRPATTLTDGLARTVAWYREHRDRYLG